MVAYMTASLHQSTFFAYAASPGLRAETLRQVVTSINDRGGSARGWESLAVDGGFLIDTITVEIDRCDSLVAEVSSMNHNVLFELGYAIAKNKPVWLAFDETDEGARRLWADTALFSTIGRTDYQGNAEKLVARFLGSPTGNSAPLAESILAGAKPREANAVFTIPSPAKHTAAVNLERFLERQNHLTILGADQDLVLAPLQFNLQEIYRSSAAVIHLLGANRSRANEHNARASFFAGFAHGMSLPLLMVVEDDFESPLDYKDLLYRYDTSAKLQEKVSDWLEKLPKSKDTGRRLGRLALDIELPIRTFGQYVAEYEVNELEKYFIHTGEFQSVLTGDARIFAGRKGTGKSATMSQAAHELSHDKSVLVVPIKPSSYELSGIADTLKKFDSTNQTEYLFMTAWIYLIQTEIALQVVNRGLGKGNSLDDEKLFNELVALLNHMNIDQEEDLSTRLERVLNEVSSKLGSQRPPSNTEIASLLRSEKLARLRTLTLRALHRFSRVSLLIDNLDKNWEGGEELESLSPFILALLVAAGRIEKDFGSLKGSEPNLVVTLALFIRTDILDVVRRTAREPDKIAFRSVDWDDEQLLVRVLEERYSASTKKPGTAMWLELFASEVRGVPTRDYFLWRTLRRPRDFIYFANASLTTAINRKHASIETSDIIYAENDYSRFAIEALIVESESAGLDLENLLFEFAGLSATMTNAEIRSVLKPHDEAEATLLWLMAASFIGVEVAEEKFDYVHGETAAKRKKRVAEIQCKTAGREMRFRVHPAFRPYLEILDDDLHG